MAALCRLHITSLLANRTPPRIGWCMLIDHIKQLHTLEDFSAHSNFCELALISLGYNDVFAHVGDAVRVRALNGKMVAPLVTGEFLYVSIIDKQPCSMCRVGTFGGSDFMYSLLGGTTNFCSSKGY